MGKRTKFQSFATAQLVLDVSTPYLSNTTSSEQNKPEKVLLSEDSELLEGIKTQHEVKALDYVDLCTLLCLCIDKKNLSADRSLTTEQMMPYVSYVLENPNHNWLIYSTALLLRSQLEKEKSRTVERSCFQLQVLVDQYNDEDPSFTDRYKWFWTTVYPSNLELQRDLGKR
jgi:hypothetical protein